MKMLMIYQDRLGTNMGKSHKRTVFSQEEEEEEEEEEAGTTSSSGTRSGAAAVELCSKGRVVGWKRSLLILFVVSRFGLEPFPLAASATDGRVYLSSGRRGRQKGKGR
jgi:hypothetical protein